MIRLLIIVYVWTVWVAGNTLRIVDIVTIQGQIWQQKNEFNDVREEWDQHKSHLKSHSKNLYLFNSFRKKESIRQRVLWEKKVDEVIWKFHNTVI